MSIVRSSWTLFCATVTADSSMRSIAVRHDVSLSMTTCCLTASQSLLFLSAVAASTMSFRGFISSSESMASSSSCRGMSSTPSWKTDE
ncbi:hypothetical protein K438DRAFT_1813473 [Mycena galopus ATCC 62051]|nr:hypothetical protein K438DRAFT_1813473 [Mycena galopus ATCC 62051]